MEEVIMVSKLNSKSLDVILATKEHNLSESELAEPQTIDTLPAQEIEERVSKSFLAVDAFTLELRGGSGSGTGSGSGGAW
jgi:hypothetical protein